MNLDRKTWWYIAGSVALLLLALGLAMAYTSVIYQAPSGEEQPKVTDWMQAWGSVAGVFAGLAAAVAATALLMFERRQAQEARRQLAEERRSQEESRARAVASGGLHCPSGTLKLDANTAEVKITHVDLLVHNFGPDPIHWVVVAVALPNGRIVEHNGTELIGPQQTEAVRIPVNPSHACTTTDANFELKLCDVTVTFTDSSGIQWNRTNNGAPERDSRTLMTLRNLIEFG
ncbi:hypothetical protein FBZ33_6538 [Micromonospora sp. A202]|uniref:hypothetical protein n=1 Tax=Micromonospora sp. A202 TaxID=2572899 RepID=UPI00114E9132|nr:hypothetical protein [Micromonospora sp. A202]TQJ26152.1 hypothetical protein FBZ33_6538 [Micromonospora sp. A202]